jgi:hypothetical protein
MLLTHRFSGASIGQMFLEDANDASMHATLNPKDLGSELLDGVSEPDELCFTLQGRSTAYAVHIVHRDATNLAGDYSLVGRLHRKFKHHALGIITDDTAAGECHVKVPCDLSGSRMTRGVGCVEDATIWLWSDLERFKPQSSLHDLSPRSASLTFCQENKAAHTKTLPKGNFAKCCIYITAQPLDSG